MTSTVLKLLEAEEQRDQEKVWKGSLGEYINELFAEPEFDPYAGFTAFQMIHTAIKLAGVDIINPAIDPRLRRLYGEEPFRRFRLFERYHGIDSEIERIVRYFEAAAKHAEESRQALFFHGEPGSGKSSLAASIVEGLERYIPWIRVVEGCDSHHSPLLLLPREIREAFQRERNVFLSGEPCQQCLNASKNGVLKTPVTSVRYSACAAVGYGGFSPSGEPAEDTDGLFGEMNGHGRNSGVIHHAGRGILEIIDLRERGVQSIASRLTTATQEHRVMTRGRRLYLDMVIIAHGNSGGYEALLKVDGMRRRVYPVSIPLNLTLSDEVLIYQQFLDSTAFNTPLAPLTLETLGTFAILTRLVSEDPCTDLLERLRIYNGQPVFTKGVEKKYKDKDGKEVLLTAHVLRGLPTGEGRKSGGIPSPLAIQILHDALAKEPQVLFPFDLFPIIKTIIEEDKTGGKKKGELLEIARKEYLESFETALLTAMNPHFVDNAGELFRQYLDHASAYVLKTKIRIRVVGHGGIVTFREEDPSESFLKSIEEQMAIIGPAGDGFRRDISNQLMKDSRREGAGKATMEEVPQLAEAIHRYLRNRVRDQCRIIVRNQMLDTELLAKKEEWKKRLVEGGYPEESIDTAFRYAAIHLWKD